MTSRTFSKYIAVFSVLILVGCGGNGNNGGEFKEDNISIQTTNNENPIKVFTTKKGLVAESFTANDKIKFNDGTYIPAKKDEILIYLKYDITVDEFNALYKKIQEIGGKIIGTDQKLMMIQVKVSNPIDAKNNLKNLQGIYDIGFNVPFTSMRIDNYEGYLNSLSNYHYSINIKQNFKLLKPQYNIINSWWMDKIDYIQLDDITTISNINKNDIEKIKENLKNKVILGIVDTGIRKGQEVIEESRLTRFNINNIKIYDDDTPAYHHGIATTAFMAGNFTNGTNIVRGINIYSKVNFVDNGRYNASKRVKDYFYEDTEEREKIEELDIVKPLKYLIDRNSAIINISQGEGCSNYSFNCDNDRVVKEGDKLFTRVLMYNSLKPLTKSSLIIRAAGNDGENSKRSEYNNKFARINFFSELYQRRIKKNTKYEKFFTKWAWDFQFFGNKNIVDGKVYDTESACKKDKSLFSSCEKVYCAVHPFLKECRVDHKGYKNYNFERDKNEKNLWDNYIITVGASAINKDGSLTDASFSRMGKNVDILAPGEQVKAWTRDSSIYNGHNIDGTSFSSPITAGVASILKGIQPSLTAPEIKKLIIKSASKNIITKYEPKIHLNMSQSIKNTLLFKDINLTKVSQIIFTQNSETHKTMLPIKIPNKLGIKALDILFLIDVSGSFNDDIEQLKLQAKTLMSEIKKHVTNIQFGVAKFSDFPQNPYGEPDIDVPYKLMQPLTKNNTNVINAINNLNNPLLNGLDEAESQLEALYKAAKDGSIGWREGAMRIIVIATDAPFHDKANEPEYLGKSFDETIKALNEKQIQVIGLNSGDTNGDLSKITNATGGAKYNLTYDSREIADSIIKGLKTINKDAELEIELVAGNDYVSEIKVVTETGEEEIIPLKKSENKYKTLKKYKPGEKIQIIVTLKNIYKKDKKLLINTFSQKLDITGGGVLIWISRNQSLLHRFLIPLQFSIFD